MSPCDAGAKRCKYRSVVVFDHDEGAILISLEPSRFGLDTRKELKYGSARVLCRTSRDMITRYARAPSAHAVSRVPVNKRRSQVQGVVHQLLAPTLSNAIPILVLYISLSWAHVMTLFVRTPRQSSASNLEPVKQVKHAWIIRTRDEQQYFCTNQDHTSTAKQKGSAKAPSSSTIPRCDRNASHRSSEKDRRPSSDLTSFSATSSRCDESWLGVAAKFGLVLPSRLIDVFCRHSFRLSINELACTSS